MKKNAKDYYSKYEDYGKINQKVKVDYINNKLDMLPNHEQLSKLDLIITQMDFDAISLYPSAIWNDISIYPKIEFGCTFKLHIIDIFVNDLNDQILKQEGNDSAVLKSKCYNPSKPIFQLLPIKEKVENIKANRMRNGCIFHTLILVDLPEIIDGWKVHQILRDCHFCRRSFEISPFR